MNELKALAIGAQIFQQILAGKTIPQAFDAVLGNGAYLKLAGEVYDELRAKGMQS
jgi:hypothetical protein